MDAYDFIISMLALNKRYCSISIKGDVPIAHLLEKIINLYPNDNLKMAGIIPHKIHNNSSVLDGAFLELLSRGILKRWTDGIYTWNFHLTPKEYFDEYISGDLPETKKSELENLAASCT